MLSAITKLRTTPSATGTAADAALVQLVSQLQGQVAALTATAQTNAEAALAAQVDQAIAEKKFLPTAREHLLAVGRGNAAALSGLINSAAPIPGLTGQTGDLPRDLGGDRAPAALSGRGGPCGRWLWPEARAAGAPARPPDLVPGKPASAPTPPTP